MAEGNSNALKGTNRLNGYYNRIDGERACFFYNENAVVNDKRVLICQTQFFSTAKVWIRPQIVQDTFRPRSLTSKKTTRSITCGWLRNKGAKHTQEDGRQREKKMTRFVFLRSRSSTQIPYTFEQHCMMKVYISLFVKQMAAIRPGTASCFFSSSYLLTRKTAEGRRLVPSSSCLFCTPSASSIFKKATTV